MKASGNAARAAAIGEALRVLFVEDTENDLLLLCRELERGGFDVQWKRVETAEHMRDALREPWDIVVSDYSLPCFDALGAIAVFKEHALEIPFIVCSGTVGEDAAVEVLKAGADDFIVKGHLARLVPAVHRELRETATRRAQHNAERALREGELRFRRIVETTVEGIWMVDAQTKTTYVNRSMAKMLGEAPEALLGRSLLDAVSGDQRPALERHMARAELSHERIECQLQRRDGSSFLASIALNPVDDGAGHTLGHLAMVVDFSDQRRMQEQLMVSDRMASVGTLAAGVAHEINNPLAAILGNLHLANGEVERLATRLGVEDTRDLREELADALEASRRVRDIVKDLKIFSRSQADSTGPIDIHAILESSLRMAWNEIRHRATVVRNYGEVPPVDGNDSRLGQVFLNLLANAMQAMEEGRADKNTLRISTFCDDAGRVVVEIEDTGMGMSPEVMRQLFTPFFTTKPVGIGTGLGLSICNRIVTNMGGAIDVHTIEGKGSRFRVSLPRAGSVLTKGPGSQQIEIPSSRRAEILVIDDEAVIGMTVRRILGRQHDVTTLTDGHAALALLADGRHYDVILCDLMMPMLSGIDLFAEVQRVSPEHVSRIVFMTGGAFTPKAHAFLAGVSNPRVEKPFEPTSLRNVVHSLLNADAAASQSSA